MKKNTMLKTTVLAIAVTIFLNCILVASGFAQENKVRPIEITGEVLVVNLNKGIPNTSPWPVVIIKYGAENQMFRLIGELEPELMKLEGKKVTVVGVLIKEPTPLYYNNTPLTALSVKNYRVHTEEKQK